MQNLNIGDDNLTQVSVFFKDIEVLSLGRNEFSTDAIRKLCDVLKGNDKVSFSVDIYSTILEHRAQKYKRCACVNSSEMFYEEILPDTVLPRS